MKHHICKSQSEKKVFEPSENLNFEKSSLANHGGTSSSFGMRKVI